MARPGTQTLRRLSDSELTVADPGQDVRGRDVCDSSGEKLGKVDDLYVDEVASQVRMLEVGSGGFLGMGKEKILVPVEAVKSVTRDTVNISRNRQEVSGAPAYSPPLANEEFLNQTYAYYGYTPYWQSGYVYPNRWFV